MRYITAYIAAFFLAAQPSCASAIDNLKAYAGPVIGEDLVFPTKPQPFGYAKASKMFKPDGNGPFPALVVMPTCAGHLSRHAFDVWAKAALGRGYAVLVVDPLTPRGVTRPAENCLPPTRVREARLRKDAFDAAEHLRKQPFVDPERVGVLGLSQGGMAVLAAAATGYDAPQDRRAFRAIVSIYPVCFLANLQIPGRSAPANIHYIADTRIVVPLLVQWANSIPKDRRRTASRDCRTGRSEERRCSLSFTRPQRTAGTSEAILPRQSPTALASNTGTIPR